VDNFTPAHVLALAEIACLRDRTMFYVHELLADATEELWTPVTLCAAENAVSTEVTGLFQEDMDDDFTQTPPSYNIAGLFRASYYLASGESSQLYNFTNPVHSAAERRRSDCISIRTSVEKSTVFGSMLSFNSYTLADASPSPTCSRVIDIPA
jgi:hypothetical protein